jgi:hypothetical protein
VPEEKAPPVPLLFVLRDLVAWLKVKQVPGIVIGGVAVSILGRPRATRDVDALIWLDQNEWESFLEVGSRFGFKPRHPDSLDFAKQARVLLVRHTASGIDVDLSLGLLPFEQEAIARVRWIEVGDVNIPLPAPEDLIVMKAVADRSRDVADIEALLDAHPRLDLRRVRRWLKEFSSALDRPAILNHFEGTLAKKRGRDKKPKGSRKKSS